MVSDNSFQLRTHSDNISSIVVTRMEQLLSKKCSPILPWNEIITPDYIPDRQISLSGAGTDSEILAIIGMPHKTCATIFTHPLGDDEFLDLFGELAEKCLDDLLDIPEIVKHIGKINPSIPVLNDGATTFNKFSTGIAGFLTVENAGDIYFGFFMKNK